MAKNKQEVEEEVLEFPELKKVTDKNLIYTKKQYEKMIIKSLKAIKIHKNDLSEKDKAELYGIYYSSFAGYLRAGALCSREMGTDGFPEIQVIINDTKVHIRESVLIGILREEAEFIIHPYEDNSSSYLEDSPFKILIPDVKETTYTVPKKQNKIPKLNSDKETEFETNINNNNNNNEVKEIEDKYKALLDEEKKKNGDLSSKLKESLKQGNILKTKIKKDEEESKKYKYDPNYDHYYNDELPAIIESLEFTKTDLLIRHFCMILCGVGLFLSFMFVI